MTNLPHPLGGPDEYGDLVRVWAWDDNQGIEIDAPGCGTAVLNDDQAKCLLAWLQARYPQPEKSHG